MITIPSSEIKPALAVVILVIVAYFLAPTEFHLTVLTIVAIHGIAAVALTLAFGYAGLISLGSSAFFGLGAYTAAFAVQKMGLPSLVGLLMGVLVCGTTGYLLARPLLRLNSHYLAMATLALGVVAYIVYGQARPFTGGLDPGIFGLEPLQIFGFKLAGPRQMYWVCWGALLISCLAGANLVHSARGRAMRALRTSEVATSCLGVDTVGLRVMVFALSSSLIGLAGGLYAFFMRSFAASAFDPGLSIDILMMVLIGSLSTLWGAVVGALVITVLPNLLEGFEHYKLLVFGLAMVAVMVFFPNGLVQSIVDAFKAAVLRRSGSVATDDAERRAAP